jgi:DNA-binding Lrp family transcriptional regulator
MHEAARFVSEKLATMKGVTSTATHFMMKTYKQSGILMHSGGDDERLKVSP